MSILSSLSDFVTCILHLDIQSEGSIIVNNIICLSDFVTYRKDFLSELGSMSQLQNNVGR